MKNPYYYREHGISTSIGSLKAYLQGESDIQGSLAVKVHDVLLTAVEERIRRLFYHFPSFPTVGYSYFMKN